MRRLAGMGLTGGCDVFEGASCCDVQVVAGLGLAGKEVDVVRSVDAYVATGNDRGRKVLDVGGHGRFTTAGDDLVVLAAVGFGQQVDVVADLKTGQRKLENNLTD
ncbi:hypothetical protein GIV51_13220 [Pseudomonas syringae]|uniref:hypothetical protein n=1 Tax=Pseudomonas syringae TaxID=317 RepID=UPI001F313BEA|nr:hypothetical protein [Pseudomonas syringae]MCF5645451.1 hypothetical protein [Pseudomonas syringae]